MDNTEVVQAELASCQHSIDSARKVMNAMSAFIKTGQAKVFIESAVAMRGDTVTSYFHASGSTLYVWMDVEQLEGMKDERLQGILQHWTFMNPDGNETTDYAAKLQRTFTFRWKVRQGKINLTVTVQVEAHIKDTSETCKKVVVGYTDGKPEPIYKLECSDSENAPAREGE